MNIHTSPRLYCIASLSESELITLSDEQAHYLLHVMRLSDGDNIRLFNQDNGEWLGAIHKTGKRGVTVKLYEHIRKPTTERDLWLCPAPIKKAHFDYMIEKATELGVTEIHPILTARTQIRDVNTARCNAMATESAEQSERLSVPDIVALKPLNSVIAQWPQDRLLIVCAERGDAEHIQSYCSHLKIDGLTKAAIMTGPEGGFAPEELDTLRRIPTAHFVRLGSRILRADTAAIAALSVWQAVCGDWTSEAAPDIR